MEVEVCRQFKTNPFRIHVGAFVQLREQASGISETKTWSQVQLKKKIKRKNHSLIPQSNIDHGPPDMSEGPSCLGELPVTLTLRWISSQTWSRVQGCSQRVICDRGSAVQTGVHRSEVFGCDGNQNQSVCTTNAQKL